MIFFIDDCSREMKDNVSAQSPLFIDRDRYVFFHHLCLKLSDSFILSFDATFQLSFLSCILLTPVSCEKCRPTVHVMVSSLLVPPPPLTSEGATTGTTNRQQECNFEPTFQKATEGEPSHTCCDRSLAELLTCPCSASTVSMSPQMPTATP